MFWKWWHVEGSHWGKKQWAWECPQKQNTFLLRSGTRVPNLYFLLSVVFGVPNTTIQLEKGSKLERKRLSVLCFQITWYFQKILNNFKREILLVLVNKFNQAVEYKANININRVSVDSQWTIGKRNQENIPVFRNYKKYSGINFFQDNKIYWNIDAINNDGSHR